MKKGDEENYYIKWNIKYIYFIIMKINLFNPKTKHSHFTRSTRATSMLSMKKVDESTLGTIGNWS